MTFRNWVSAVSSVKPSAIADVGTITAIEWTADVQTMGPFTGPFAQHRVHFMHAPWFYAVIAPGILGAQPPWNPGDYGVFHSGPQNTCFHGWTTLGPDPVNGYVYNGVSLLVDPELSPRQAHRFGDTDGTGVGPQIATGGSTTHLTGTFPIGQPGYTAVIRPGTAQEEIRSISVRIANRIDWTTPLVNGAVVGGVTEFEIRAQRTTIDARDTLILPTRVKHRIQKIGSVVNPTGNLWRNVFTGEWKTFLPGTYSLYKVSNEFYGTWRDAGVFYMLSPNIEDWASGVFGLVMEMHYDEPDNPIANIPADVRWSKVRVFDSATARWHEIHDHAISSHSNTGSDLDWGWSVSVEPGKLCHRAGVSGEKAVGIKMLSGLTYENAATGAPLGFDSIRDVGEGAALYHGPVWGGAGVQPYIMQDSGRGWYIANAVGTTTPVRFVHVADADGLYTFDGDFALAHTLNASGGGAHVSIVSDGIELFSMDLPVGVTDPDAPFSGPTGKHFVVSRQMLAGAVTYFTITGTPLAFDAVAFDLAAVSFSVAVPAQPPEITLPPGVRIGVRKRLSYPFGLSGLDWLSRRIRRIR